ncbi:MAG: ribosome small subunit-dependent GTPase A [Candidatus Eisenbacteria bacterium]
MSSQLLGWNARLQAAALPFREQGLEPMRIAREDRDRYIVLTPEGTSPAVLSGRYRHAAQTRSALPAVGDWVMARADANGPATISALLPRASAFMRKVAGDTTEEQVVAANVESVFLVCGLDGDFNPRRIERALTAAWESGAQPVVVLNKADLATDPDARVAETVAVAPGAPVVALSALAGRGLEALSPWLVPGHTIALIGSSGAGKSTLTNALLGESRQAIGAVRDDSRGRHTTTHRELVPLPSGALLLDTPGMRELQLWGDDSGLDGAFPELAALAARCRFGDCSHAAEPGCAVLEAVAEGTLEAVRLAAWRKLQRELRYLAGRQDARIRVEDMTKWKAIHKSMRGHPKADRWRR